MSEMTEPLISLVCSTIGRPMEFRRLIESVRAADIADMVEFVLVDQSDDHACTDVLTEDPLPGPWHAGTSLRGLSRGRNIGLGKASASIVAFPDDNCWFPPDTFRRVVELLESRPDVDGVSGMQVTSSGNPSMLRWKSGEGSVSRSNFLHTTISSTLFLRTAALPSKAPFDEEIGAGSPGWRGAGEDSDLVLTLLDAGSTILYRPDIHVFQDDDREEITEEFVAKMLKYGVGQGYLWRSHRLSKGRLTYYSARKLAGSGVRALRGDTISARADLAFLRGQLAGWRGIDP